MSTQLEAFKKHLEQFATKHKNEIRKNAEFRNHFQQMCARIGVDPLACMYIVSCDCHVTLVVLNHQLVKGSGHKHWEWVTFITRYNHGGVKSIIIIRLCL